MKMKKLIRLISIFCLIGVFAFPALANMPFKSKNEDDTAAKLDERLNILEKTVEQMNIEIEQLNTKVDSMNLSSRLNNITGNNIEPLEAALNEMDKIVKVIVTNMNALQSQFDALQNRSAYADSLNYEILAQLISLENRLLSLTEDVKTVPTEVKTPAAISAVDPTKPYQEKYLQALNFHQNARHAEAIEIFRQLLNDDTTHDLSDNAQYWIGECYYSLKQYDRAIIEFKKVFAFPESNKNDDAQYKLGVCYVALGDESKAKAAFQRLVQLYPDSEYNERIKQIAN